MLRLMAGDNHELIEAAIPYFTTVCFSYVLYAATTSLAGMLRNVEVVMAAMYTSRAAAIINVFFNWVLIFGKLGFPAMGVAGAALATVISRVAEFTVIALYAFGIQKKFPITVTDMLHTKPHIFMDFMKYGFPITLGDSQWAFVGVIKAAIIGHLGTLMVSANAIADSIMGLGFIASSSLATGAIVVVGKEVGVGNNKKAREYSNTIQIIFACMAVVMASLVFGLRGPIAGLFDVSDNVREYAVRFIQIGAFTLLGTLYHASCFVGINRGGGDGRFVLIVDMICGWFIVIPLLYLSAHVLRLALPLVYLASRIDQCFKWIIAFIRLRGNKWIHNVTRETEPSAAQ
jgi:putative MATE family efflux protein